MCLFIFCGLSRNVKSLVLNGGETLSIGVDSLRANAALPWLDSNLALADFSMLAVSLAKTPQTASVYLLDTNGFMLPQQP